MKDEIISVDSAKAGGDKTVWTTNGTDKLVTVGHSQGQNTVQGLAISDPSSGLVVSDLVWRPKIGDYVIEQPPSELCTLAARLDQYTRLSENLIFRNAYGWCDPGYWVNDRLKELIAEYPDWNIVVDNDLTAGTAGSDILITSKDKYRHSTSLSSVQSDGIAITYILDMLIVKWYDKGWSFTFEKQDKDSFLNDFDRVLKIITSILDHITKRRKEDENMKKSLDIIATGAYYK